MLSEKVENNNNQINIRLLDIENILDVEKHKVSNNVSNTILPYRAPSFDTTMSNRLYFFTHNSIEINILNIQTMSNQAVNLDFNKYISMNIGICLINENKLFCTGNFPSSNLMYIWDPSTNTTQEIPNNMIIPRKTGLAYLNGFVYMFGGNNGWNSIRDYKKFDLLSNQWIVLPRLPMPGSSISCEIFKENILVTGLYSINQNSHKSVLDGLTYGSKTICIR